MTIKLNATHIESGTEYLDDKVFDNKEIVLPSEKEYTLIIDYPLKNAAKFKIKTGKRGFTRSKLVATVIKYYKKVYQIEDSTSNILPGKIPGMLNRNITNGMFGIWGHDIGDLILVDCLVSRGKIYLGVDS